MSNGGDPFALYAVRHAPGGSRGVSRHERSRRWQRIGWWTLGITTGALLVCSTLLTLLDAGG